MTTADDLTLRAFVFTCRELRSTSYGAQFTIAAHRSYRMQVNSPRLLQRSRLKNLSMDEWRSFLLSFRKLVSESEIGNVFRTLNSLSKLGSRADQVRIRRIRSELRAVEKSSAGVTVGIGPEFRPIVPREAFLAMTNGVLFHNDPKYSDQLHFLCEASPFSSGPVLHYVVFTYLQALRIDSAIAVRGYV